MVCTLHITHPQGLQGRWVHTRRPLKGCGTGLGTPGSPVLSSPTPISLFTLIFTRPPERMNLSPVFPPFARSSHFQYLRLRRCNRDFCRGTSEHRVVSTMASPRQGFHGYSRKFDRGCANDYRGVEEFEGVILEVANVRQEGVVK